MEVRDVWFHPKFAGLGESHRYKVMYGGRAGLKCLALGTRVIMFDGSLRAIEDVHEGELLMGPDSTPRKVLNTCRGTGPLYKIKQTAGMEYIVNEAHILALRKSDRARRDIDEFWTFSHRRPNGRYSTTPDYVNLSVTDFRSKSAKWKDYFVGYKTECLKFTAQQTLPIDPYFLGIWLGDGTSRELAITTMDTEIVDYCRELSTIVGVGFSIHGKIENAAITLGLPKISGRTNPLWQNFIALNLPNNKHIPQPYMVAGEKERLELLAGLIDTDGTKSKECAYSVYSSYEPLARQIKLLADCLGFHTSISRHKTTHRDNFQVYISGDVWRIPCKISRKKTIPKKLRFHPLESRIQVEPIGEGEFAGFELDGDHLFLLEDGTVTHNSWTTARLLVIFGMKKRLRILCAREYQKSIKESVHELIESQIKRLGYESFYTIQRDAILGRNGTEFIFTGLKNITNIKSYEDVDIWWVEEAETVSEGSWETLTPTARKAEGGPFGMGAEIWVTFNPRLETDATYRRFVVSQPPDTFVVKTTYKDNPYVSSAVLAEIAHDKATNFDKYLHVWEGFCKQTLEGAVYADELREATNQERIVDIPMERTLPVSTYWDLGRSDHTSIWFIQQVGYEYRVVDFYESRLKHIDHYLEVLQNRHYVYDTIWLPHDAKAKLLGTKMTIEEQVRAKFPNIVRIVPKVSIKDKINAARTIFPQCWFDRKRCAEGLQHLRHYSYEVLSPGNVAMGIPPNYSPAPLHDEHSDAASAFEYFAVASKLGGRKRTLNLGRMMNATIESIFGDEDTPVSRAPKGLPKVPGGLGWLG